jgi:glycosyltransferase involved in cell wall biosynthesis
MRRIAILSQFYPPEPCAAANRVAALASALAAAGNDVCVYTAMPSFPEGIVAADYRGRITAVERDGALTVERVWTALPGVGLPGERVLGWLSVALGIALRLATVAERYDVVIVSSPPITLALPALLGAFAHRAELIADVRDVFPEIAVAMRAWPAEGALAKTVGRVADALYRRAALISCVTASARDEIAARGVPLAKLALVPNGFDPVEPASEAATQPLLGVSDVVYVGNMGLATGLDVVLDAAARLRDERSVRFVLVGGGADAARLRRRAHAERLGNVLFTGPLPRASALRTLADAPLSVVPLVASIADSIPTKLFDAMLVGTPIVLCAAGEAQRLVERSQSGVCVAPGDADALAAAIRRLLADGALRARLSAAGPPFVREHYDRGAAMRLLAERVVRLSRR